MFRYVKYNKIQKPDTVLEFRGGDDDTVKVNYFDVDVVSIEATLEADIDALVAQQASEIGCTIITQAEFKTLVSGTAQLKRIREVVASEISKNYTLSDEIGISRRAIDDAKRVTYDTYVKTCTSKGTSLKALVGY